MGKLYSLLYGLFLIAACSSGDRKYVPEISSSRPGIDSAGWPTSFQFGTFAEQSFIDSLDIDVRPDGKGLPQGHGDARYGQTVYKAKCLSCHGDINVTAGVKLPAPLLIYNPDSPHIKTIGNYLPYATTIFDYVRRAMPQQAPGSLAYDEIYALTAYLLYANKILDSITVLNAELLPRIVMPANNRFVPDDRRGGPEIK